MRLLVLALVACGHPAPARTVATPTGPPLPVEATAETSIAELGDTTVLFTGPIATIVRGGALTARVAAPHAWIGGATIDAPDGEGRWVVGLDRDGSLWRITGSGEREEIGDRFSAAQTIARIGAAAGTLAFQLADSIAFTVDGAHLARVAPPSTVGAVVQFAVGRDRVAFATSRVVFEWDLTRGTQVSYPIAGTTGLGFIDAATKPRLLIAATALYLETSGALQRIQAPAKIDALATSGSRGWLLAGGSLWVLDHDRLAQIPEPRAVAVIGANNGDVWLVSAAHTLVRYQLGTAVADPDWQAEVAPVLARTCLHCHAPGGSADFDLSTPQAWRDHRREITERVFVKQTMPPAGTDLTQAERDQLRRWLAR